jgi:hypothetical protein
MKYLNNNKIFVFYLLTTLIFWGCKDKEKEIASIPVKEIHLENFEDEIFSLNDKNFAEQNKILSKKYFPFYHYFVKNIVYFRREMDSTYQLVLDFVNDKDIRYTYNETKKIFTPEERKKIENAIHQLHQHIHYYFPQKKLPERYLTFISGFNYQIVYPENTNIIGIALDMYLGSKHQVYQWLQWPQYRVKQLQKEFIPVDIAKAWLFTEYPYRKYNNLLEHAMYYGKIIYALKQLLPQTHDTLIFSYSQKQLQYCKKYEKNLWAYFLEENKWYDNSPKVLSQFLNDGPFTAAISKECPPRIAMYLAYKIVDSYVTKKKDVTLDQLLREENAQKILQESKYKP